LSRTTKWHAVDSWFLQSGKKLKCVLQLAGDKFDTLSAKYRELALLVKRTGVAGEAGAIDV
jgi:hypothetical protein